MACQLAVEFLQWFHFRRVIVRSTPLPFFCYWTCPWKKQYVKHACWAVGATLFVTFVFGFPPLLCCPDWLDKLWCFPIIIGTIDS
jgi:hypothetical protein